MDFAKSHWENTPENLGIDDCVCDTIQGYQTIGLQLDEMSSFSGNKKNKQWIQIAYNPHLQVTLACHIGGKGKENAQKFQNKIPQKLKNLKFETDHSEAYKALFLNSNIKQENNIPILLKVLMLKLELDIVDQ